MTRTTKAIDDLACQIAEAASQDDIKLPEKLDALEKLTAYYALLVKHGGRNTPATGAEPTMDDITRKMREASDDTEETQPNGRVQSNRRVRPQVRAGEGA